MIINEGGIEKSRVVINQSIDELICPICQDILKDP